MCGRFECRGGEKCAEPLDDMRLESRLGRRLVANQRSLDLIKIWFHI